MTSRKIVQSTISITAGVLLLAAGLAILTYFNPMRLAFMATFEVRNDTARDFQMVPIGMREGDGDYGPLPMYDSTELPLRRRDNIRFTVSASGVIVVNYDCDDINFRHLLLKDKNGRQWIMDTDKRGAHHSCYGPQQSQYIIRDDQIVPAPQELLPCFEGEFVQYSGAVDYK